MTEEKTPLENLIEKMSPCSSEVEREPSKLNVLGSIPSAGSK